MNTIGLVRKAVPHLVSISTPFHYGTGSLNWSSGETSHSRYQSDYILLRVSAYRCSLRPLGPLVVSLLTGLMRSFHVPDSIYVFDQTSTSNPHLFQSAHTHHQPSRYKQHTRMLLNSLNPLPLPRLLPIVHAKPLIPILQQPIQPLSIRGTHSIHTLHRRETPH